MRCFVIGSKELSVRVLEELVAQGHMVLGVLSRDEEPGMKVWHEKLGHRSLKKRAMELGVPVFEGMNINSAEMVKVLSGMNLDVLFCAFWGEMVKEKVLNLPKRGCFNLHTALLPRHRGCYPLPWAIISGDEHAGLTIHRMQTGVDDGPTVAQVKVTIAKGETGESIYRKITAAGAQLFKQVLPTFADGSYKLAPQCDEQATYHPRAQPYGGQVNPYWNEEYKSRFKNALHFLPFAGHSAEPRPFLTGFSEPGVRLMLGFDCDRPRGSFIASEAGSEMAERKLQSIVAVSKELDALQIPRTFFLCGQFLESMSFKFGAGAMKCAFQAGSPLVEIGDHSYSHDTLAKIVTRPDKKPMSPKQVAEDYAKMTGIFKELLSVDIPKRGYRTPLGHYHGLVREFLLLDKMKSAGVAYVSSDLRDANASLNPQLTEADGTPRQPYRYPNGLLEIPSVGWQDTAFHGSSKTSLFEQPPRTYSEIMRFYRGLISGAKKIAINQQRDYFLGLVLHPYDNSFYNTGNFFHDLAELASDADASFCTYGDVAMHHLPK